MKVLYSQEVVSLHRCGVVPGQVTVQASAPPGVVVCPLLVTPGGRLEDMAHSNTLIFMHFHVVLFGNQHEISSKQHNGKVKFLPTLVACISTRGKFYAKTLRVYQ